MRSRFSQVEGIDGLATLFKQAGLDLGPEDLADALWLAQRMGGPRVAQPSPGVAAGATPRAVGDVRVETLAPAEDEPAAIPLILPRRDSTAQGQSATGIPIQLPAAPALRISLALARSLRPLRRQVPSPSRLELDEAATVQRIADQRLWAPVLRPAPERWLEVALVVEAMPALPLWHDTLVEFQTLLERQGAFRRVTTWRLQTAATGAPALYPHWRVRPAAAARPARAQQLFDPSGRRLILLLSDCTSAAWHQGTLWPWLQRCTQGAPTAVIQLLPPRLWAQTALPQGTPVWLRAFEPGTPSARLISQVQNPMLQRVLNRPPPPRRHQLQVPVVPLAAEPLKQWAQVVAARGEGQTVGFQFDLRPAARRPAPADPGEEAPVASPLAPEERVQQFCTTASGTAQRLAELMSAVPVSPPIVDLIRQTLLPAAEPVHVAEVFMGGLMVAQWPEGHDLNAAQATPHYDFAPGVRTLLADQVSTTDTLSVLDAVTGYIAARLKLSIRNFEALLRLDLRGDPEAADLVLPFAEIAVPTLARMGGEFADIAAQLASLPKVAPPPPVPRATDLFPLLQTFTFREATVALAEAATAPPPEPEPSAPALDEALSVFEFETVTVQVQQQGGQAQLTLQRQQRQGRHLIDALGPGVDLALVLVPAGEFVMGAPDDEAGRSGDEGPQHRVTIAEPFLLGKPPVTQAQYAAVMGTNPATEYDAERFVAPDKPVVGVRWEDSVEFCQRLAQATGRPYRLPTEAEWEYACRAGTTTPFHFGPTLTTDLANYDGNRVYGAGVKGEYRQQTTVVGSFPANAFGLYDMHGNVWEWCQDLWHGDYTGAPEDGSAWLVSDDPEEQRRVLRGGSWFYDPEVCRSAVRFGDTPDFRDFLVGLRVACGLART